METIRESQSIVFLAGDTEHQADVHISSVRHDWVKLKHVFH